MHTKCVVDNSVCIQHLYPRRYLSLSPSSGRPQHSVSTRQASERHACRRGYCIVLHGTCSGVLYRIVVSYCMYSVLYCTDHPTPEKLSTFGGLISISQKNDRLCFTTFSVGNLSASRADARTPNALASHDCCPITSPRYRVASLEAGTLQ